MFLIFFVFMSLFWQFIYEPVPHLIELPCSD